MKIAKENLFDLLKEENPHLIEYTNRPIVFEKIGEADGKIWIKRVYQVRELVTYTICNYYNILEKKDDIYSLKLYSSNSSLLDTRGNYAR